MLAIANAAGDEMKSIEGLQSIRTVRVADGKLVVGASYDTEESASAAMPKIQAILGKLVTVLTAPPEIQGGLQAAPFQQSWFGRFQVRVSSIRLFLLWDNLTLRGANQDYPGRVLPQTRAMYGIRWTLWN